jgi:HK97 family phage portal protein
MWNFFKPKKLPEIKQSLGEHIHNKEHEYASTDLKAYAREGYGANSTMYACISLVADAFGAIPLHVKVNDEIVEDHPLKQLLDRPNPDEGGVEFRTAACSWMLLAGNNFAEKVKPLGEVQELWNWQPYEMSVGRAKGQFMPYMYTFGKGTANQKSWPVDQITGTCDMLHWRTFNPDPENPSMGMAPIKAGASEVDQANAASKWRYNTLKNNAKPSGVISGESIDPTNKKTIQESIKRKQQGANGAHEVMVLSGDLKWQQLAMSPSDMDWLAGSKMLSQEIASVFRVPTQLLGIEGSQTYANFEEAKLALYTQAVLPKLELYISELNRWLSPEYGENVKICYEQEEILALEPLRREKRAELLSTDVLTINEKRAILGYSERSEEEANQLFIQPNEIPLDETFADLDDDGEENTGEE